MRQPTLLSGIPTPPETEFSDCIPPDESPLLNKTTHASSSKQSDLWFYPGEIANDLQGVDLPAHFIGETLACAWEYARCVIPEYTNWTRYIAFARIIVIGIIAEFRGSLVDIAASNRVLGYDVDELLSTLFSGMPIHAAMAREFRAFLLVTADKASARRHDSELFHRYVTAIAAGGPRAWFRLRDCDALARFTIAAALACNDHDNEWFSGPELDALTELCDTMYDAVAYYKHRAEGETNSTFAYAGADLRAESFRTCRELLWQLDVEWAPRSPARRCAVNFMRLFAGPIHAMMRRYRFVEDGLTLGNPETETVVDQTRQNFKLWNRVDGAAVAGKGEGGKVGWSPAAAERYADALRRSDFLMFEGLAELLEASEAGRCGKCQYKGSYGSEIKGQFGGVRLCEGCRAEWRSYIQSFPARAAKVFPFLGQRSLVERVDG
ncbi:hypothetical protein B0T19DRAFT_439405 [Cercophora scortea]|uniref:ABA 3 protein n=1 Tax=Cercophora scortea TaxID=314031 RepID=A0AAE0IWX7_9PEZI|nr:hypothetical protein B0T19DRAFT_439405 [Cercophora scortea]